MDRTSELAAILAVGVALAGLILAGQRATRAGIAELRERMARLEGLFNSFTKRGAAPPAEYGVQIMRTQKFLIAAFIVAIFGSVQSADAKDAIECVSKKWGGQGRIVEMTFTNKCEREVLIFFCLTSKLGRVEYECGSILQSSKYKDTMRYTSVSPDGSSGFGRFKLYGNEFFSYSLFLPPFQSKTLGLDDRMKVKRIHTGACFYNGVGPKRFNLESGGFGDETGEKLAKSFKADAEGYTCKGILE